jgi:hypothetical protein
MTIWEGRRESNPQPLLGWVFRSYPGATHVPHCFVVASIDWATSPVRLYSESGPEPASLRTEALFSSLLNYLPNKCPRKESNLRILGVGQALSH